MNTTKQRMQNQHTKNVAFLYTKNKLSEKEIKKTITFTITTKRIKHLRKDLNRKVKDLYVENSKTLSEEIQESTNKNGKIFQSHEMEKLPYYLKQSNSIKSYQNSEYFSQKF